MEGASSAAGLLQDEVEALFADDRRCRVLVLEQMFCHAFDIFDVLDPSKKSFNHVKRAFRIAKEVQIDFKHFYIIGGYRFPEDLEAKAQEDTDLEYLGKVAYDKNVEANVLLGRSLFDLPSNSPAYLSITKIMEKAGYSKQ